MAAKGSEPEVSLRNQLIALRRLRLEGKAALGRRSRRQLSSATRAEMSAKNGSTMPHLWRSHRG